MNDQIFLDECEKYVSRAEEAAKELSPNSTTVALVRGQASGFVGGLYVASKITYTQWQKYRIRLDAIL